MIGLRLVLASMGASLRRPRPEGVLGALVLVLVLGIAAAAPWSGYPVGADVDPASRGLPPSLAHPLGTDHLGRDVFWRALLASRAFAAPGLLACAVAGSVGVSLGALAGWNGGVTAALIRFLLGSIASVPRLVLVLLVCTVYGSGPLQLSLAAGVAGVPPLAEIVFARIEQLKSAEFVLASRAHGVPLPRLLLAHLVGAACGRSIARQLLATFGSFVVLECTLSYLGGLGVREPMPSWGNMLIFDWGRGAGASFLAPAAAIWLTVVATSAAGRLFAERGDA
ncbi:MAG TPA: ABC transporter permease [Deltaproteobacteria bacterium]|nr:ABC transporter permease [Deltaproteobacteria bacterium]